MRASGLHAAPNPKVFASSFAMEGNLEYRGFDEADYGFEAMAKKQGIPVPISTEGSLEDPLAIDEWLHFVGKESATVAKGGHVTHGLTAKDVSEAYAAVAFANCAGYVLDAKLDVTWSTVGVRGEEAVVAAHAKLLQYIDKWFTEQNSPAIYLWVLEWGKRRGLHSHLMLWLPEHQDVSFQNHCCGWISRIANRRPIEDRDEHTYLAHRDPEGVFGQWARFRYMMKGISPYAAIATPTAPLALEKFANIERRFQGFVNGPRWGCSRAIDRTAREPDARNLPSMTLCADGPQLYGDQFLQWNRKMRRLDHFAGNLAPRDAVRLIANQ